jgi:putative ABC transport system permease protein
MDGILGDVRFAMRSLATSRLFTAVALVSLALGIGANVTVFSLVNALAFKPLPYAAPDQLVDLHESSATKLCAGCAVGTSLPTYLDWRSSARSFTGMAAYVERPFAVSGTEAAERVGGALISGGTFALLGVHPALGRDIQPDDDRIGAPPVVLLGDGVWTRRYGADRAIVGRTIHINGVAHTVIGVMPPRFRFPEFADLWVPLTPNAAGTSRDDRQLGVVARLAPRISIAKADAEMAAIARGVETLHPETQRGWTANATSLRSDVGGVESSLYLVMLAAVGFVLLIVCANLAGLLLARGARRQKEIAIRLALGASRARLVRHLLTESILLSAAGGALGMLAAVWGVDLAVQSMRAQAPFWVDFRIDGAAVAFCAALSAATALLFGLLPALRSSHADLNLALKDGSGSVRRSHLRGLLVIGELALSLILLAGAGVLMKSFLRISAPGGTSDPRTLLTGRFEFLDARYRDGAAIRSTIGQITDRVAQVPGVLSVATERSEFIAGFGAADQVIQAEGASHSAAGVSPRFYHVVTPDYFSVTRRRIVAGRGFDAADRAGSPLVVILSKHVADGLWPGEPAVGRRIKLGAADSLPWLTIVGVLDDAVSRGRVSSDAYVPFSQSPGDRATLLIRAATEPMRLADAIRAAVKAVDPDLPLLDLQTAEQEHHATYWPYEMYALIMGLFAALAVGLSVIGLYGVIAYNAAQRTKEIGIRMALGADSGQVVRLIAREGSRLVAVAIVLGIAGAAGLLRVLERMLFGASAVDLPVFALGSALLASAALLAIWLPARRASRIQPLEALRTE